MKKHQLSITVLAFASTFAAFALPLQWTVETSRITEMRFEAFHGETLELEASFNALGNPLELTSNAATLYYQTNGMNQSWWSAAGCVSGNVARATFTPSMDPGARQILAFLCVGTSNRNYRANARITFKNSPGTTPNLISPPVAELDFDRITLRNEKWYRKAYVDQATNDVLTAAKNYTDNHTTPGGSAIITTETDPVFTAALTNGITMTNADATSTLTANGFTTDGTFVYVSDGNSLAIVNTDVDFSSTDYLLFGDDFTSLTDLLAAKADSSASITNGGAKAYADANFRTLADNICHASVFSRWVKTSGSIDVGNTQPEFAYSEEYDDWLWQWENGSRIYYASGETDSTHLGFGDPDGEDPEAILFSAAKSIVATSGQPFVTANNIPSTNGFITSIAATTIYNSLTTNTNPTFSNAVLAVGLGIGTNEVAQINAILTESGDTPIGQATTVGGLLVALAAAVAWLRKNKLTKGMTNGQPTDDNVSQLFTNNNTLLNTAIDNRLPYTIGGASSATLADRAVNNLTMNGNVTLVFPTAVSGKARDFLLVVDYADGELSLPQGITKVGDSFTMTPGKDYLIAFTEISTNYFFIRSIELS